MSLRIRKTSPRDSAEVIRTGFALFETWSLLMFTLQAADFNRVERSTSSQPLYPGWESDAVKLVTFTLKSESSVPSWTVLL